MVDDEPTYSNVEEYVEVEEKYETWFQELKPLSVEEILGLVTLRKRSDCLKDWEK